MKKIIVLLLLLTGCSFQTKNNINENETYKKTEINNNCDLYFDCQLANDTVIHNEYLQISLYVQDGKLRFVDDLYNIDFILDEYEKVRYIANNNNCAGMQHFLIVGDENIYGFTLDWRDENTKFTRENFDKMVKQNNIYNLNMKIAYDGDLKNVYSCEDTRISTTCGNPKFYIEKSDNNMYLIDFENESIGPLRDEVIEFRDFFYLDNISGYLMWMNDNTIKIASFIDNREVIHDVVFLDENNEKLVAEFVYINSMDNTVNFITKDGKHYTITNDEITKDVDNKPTLNKLSISGINYEINQGGILNKFEVVMSDGSMINYPIDYLVLLDK